MRPAASRLSIVLPLAVLASCALYFAYLLIRYSYDGLYGQDSYAYYYQAQALWNDISNQPQPANALITNEGSQGFRWSIGYHLQIIAGFLFGMSEAGGGPEGGRFLTLLEAALSPMLLYLLVQKLWTAATSRAQALAGFVAAFMLLLNGTYVRFGLSLMSDVPSLFWSLLALLFFLKARKLRITNYYGTAKTPRSPRERQDFGDWGLRVTNWGTGKWALAAGLAFGVAVLVRYGSVLLIVPVLVYLLVDRKTQAQGQWWRGEGGLLIWVAAGFAIALLPQAAYYLTHSAGAGYSAFLGDWNVANFFSNRVTSADGTATFNYPVILFYLLTPLVSTSAGFLSPFYLPAIALGGWALFRERRWPTIALLSSWWLFPALVFSGTPYQAHRFVLLFLPALAIVAGIGTATALDFILPLRNSATGPRSGALKGSYLLSILFKEVQTRDKAARLAAAVVLFMVCVGAIQGWRGTDQWVRTHVSFKEQERAIVALAHEAAGGSTPRVVSFGTTAALYYYTRWPVLDFYNYDEQEIENFFKGPGVRLIVVPEKSMSARWVGTPSGTRWAWLQTKYQLQPRGKAGEYSVYIARDRP